MFTTCCVFNGVAADDLWLIQDGQPFATIVGPKKATPWPTKAAEWLVNYAEKVTDATLFLYRLIVVNDQMGAIVSVGPTVLATAANLCSHELKWDVCRLVVRNQVLF